MTSSLLKKAHLFRCARITRSNVLPEYACAGEFIARLASGAFLIRLREGVEQGNLRELIVVSCIALMLSGCAAAVATDGETQSAENQETAAANCPHLREQQASCEALKKAYDDGLRAGKEIIAAEFRTRTELNQPNVWKPPMVSEVDMPARLVNGVMIPAHREFVIVKPGYWVRTEKCSTR